MSTRPTITIRGAGIDDIASVGGIYRHHVQHGVASFETDPPSDDDMACRFEKLMEGGYPYLVAEVAGQVVGYAYAGPYRTRPAYGNTVENSVYVDSAAVGGGVGRALLEALIEAATARGFRQMVAIIGDSGNAPSIALHRSCGFADAGVLKNVGFKHGRWLDSVFMQRALGDGDTTPPNRSLEITC